MYERAFEVATILSADHPRRDQSEDASRVAAAPHALATQAITRGTPIKRLIDSGHRLEADRCVVCVSALGRPFSDLEPAGQVDYRSRIL